MKTKLILQMNKDRELELEYKGTKGDLIKMVTHALKDHEGYRDIIHGAVEAIVDEYLFKMTGKNFQQLMKEAQLEKQLANSKGRIKN